MIHQQIDDFEIMFAEFIKNYLTNEKKIDLERNFQEKNQDTISICIAEKDYKRLCNVVAIRSGFNMRNKGTGYLIESIIYLYENELSIRQCNLALEEVSLRNKTSIKTVRADISTALKSMKRFTNIKLFSHFFPEYDGRKIITPN